MFFTAILSALLLASTASDASPIATQSLIVFSPRIITPTAGVVWPAGSTQSVTWETANIPTEKRQSTGLILLGYDGRRSENLDIGHPLAANFPITRGHMTITVPNVTMSRNDFFIVLFGDSGNFSPKFKITKP